MTIQAKVYCKDKFIGFTEVVLRDDRSIQEQLDEFNKDIRLTEYRLDNKKYIKKCIYQNQKSLNPLTKGE